MARARLLGLDAFELCCLVALAGVSVAVLLPLALQGRSLSGADGVLAPDQFQYFAWIREAAEHGLIGNRFDLAPGSRPFLHPGFGISGLLHRVTGVSIPVAYLLWKPVAVGVTFAGCLLYVRRLLPPGGRRRAALVIALFSVMPAASVGRMSSSCSRHISRTAVTPTVRASECGSRNRRYATEKQPTLWAHAGLRDGSATNVNGA